MIPRRVLHHEALRDHAIQQLQAHRGRIEQSGIEIPSEHASQAFLLLPQRVGEFLLGNFLAACAGDFAHPGRFALGPLDPPERERRDDDQAEDYLQQALVLGDEVEHFSLETNGAPGGAPFLRIWRSGRDSNPRPPA